MDKMRTEQVAMRSKNNDAGRTRHLDCASTIIIGSPQKGVELDNLEQSATVTQEERTRLQLHSSAVTVEIVSLRQELEDSRAATASARVSEEAGRLQLARIISWLRTRP